MFDNLGDLLCTITGFDSFSLQPNAGAAGEYAGLMVIRAYHLVCAISENQFFFPLINIVLVYPSRNILLAFFENHL